jgi:hypothetical protein
MHFHLHHNEPIPVEEPTQCPHWMRIGDYRWQCTENVHDETQDHYNDVIHAIWR